MRSFIFDTFFVGRGGFTLGLSLVSPPDVVFVSIVLLGMPFCVALGEGGVLALGEGVVFVLGEGVVLAPNHGFSLLFDDSTTGAGMAFLPGVGLPLNFPRDFKLEPFISEGLGNLVVTSSSISAGSGGTGGGEGRVWPLSPAG